VRDVTIQASAERFCCFLLIIPPLTFRTTLHVQKLGWNLL